MMGKHSTALSSASRTTASQACCTTRGPSSAGRRRIGVGKNRLLVELLLGETAAPQQQSQDAHADGEQAGEPEREARVAERDACVEELGRTVERQSAGDQQRQPGSADQRQCPGPSLQKRKS